MQPTPIPSDIVAELNRHPHLTAEERTAIETYLTGFPPMVAFARAARGLDVAPRTLSRLLAREPVPSFKLSKGRSGARRIPRATLARLLAKATV